MTDQIWAGVPVAADLATMIDSAAVSAGLPRNVLRAHVLGEGVSGGRVNARAVGDAGASIGLLQLHEQGQGSGMSVAQREDPATNLAVGVPPIAAAYAASSALGNTRARILATAANSGHPGNPDSFVTGSYYWKIATDGNNRIADLWERLERESPTISTDALTSPVTVARGLDSITSMIKAHPLEAVAAAAGAALVLFGL